jgi:ketosteroid isomerase-like protein
MTTAAPSATEAVARELVEYCKAGRNLDAIGKLYSPDIVSIEPMDFEGMPAKMTGIDAIRKKNEWWYANFDVNKTEVEGPYVNGDQFAVKYRFDTTNKKTGQRGQNSEIAVYTAKDGKVVQERFFHNPQER